MDGKWIKLFISFPQIYFWVRKYTTLRRRHFFKPPQKLNVNFIFPFLFFN